MVPSLSGNKGNHSVCQIFVALPPEADAQETGIALMATSVGLAILIRR